MQKHDISTEADVKTLVDAFYIKVLADPLIGFIFTEVAKISFEKHMPIMYSFWSSLLLGKNTYSGNPMLKHTELDKKVLLQKEHFQRWVELWKATVHENFEGPKAEEAAARAEQIAGVMMSVVERGRG